MKIILSIKPQYVEKLFSGEKKFEYRKKIPRFLQEVVVYSSSPVKKVIGKLYVKSILEDTPAMMWQKTGAWGGITNDDYEHYFRNRERGYAIEVLRVKKFRYPRELAYYGVKVPPQSYMYM